MKARADFRLDVAYIEWCETFDVQLDGMTIYWGGGQPMNLSNLRGGMAVKAVLARLTKNNHSP